MGVTQISQWSIDQPKMPQLGYFGHRKLRGRAKQPYDLADDTVNPSYAIRDRLQAGQRLFEAPATLGFYIPSEPKRQKPAEIVRNVQVAQEPYARSQLYGMLNAVALCINGRTPEDPLLEEQAKFLNRVGGTDVRPSDLDDRTLEQYQATARALLTFDFHDFLLDFSQREGEYATGLEYSQHPQVEVSHSFDNRFPIEQFRLQRFMKRYGLQMRDVVDVDTWSDTFKLDTKYGHRHGLTEAQFQEMARRYLALVDQAAREKSDKATATGQLKKLMIDDYKLGRGYLNPEVAIELRAVPKRPVNWQEKLSVL
jgi:hypothetical protein